MNQRFPTLAAVALFLLPFTVLAETATLRMCYDSAEFQPYFNGKDQVPAANPGLAIEQLVMPAAARAGFQLELYRRPWNRCMDDMQNNRTDAILPAAWTPERESWGRFPGPQRSLAKGVDPLYSSWAVNYTIIVAYDSPLQWDGSSFHNLQRGLSAPLGHLANERLQQMGVLQSGSIKPETALNMILHQRLDGYVMEQLICQSLIRQNGLQDKLKILQPPLFQADWYVPVTHQFYATHAEQVWRFWEGLVEQRRQLEPQLQQQLQQQAMNAKPMRQN